jgi:outer membrane protein assembly factor BamB
MNNVVCRLIGLLLLAVAGPLSAQISGWRGDGAGRWPDADPPITWDDSGKNILWQTEVGKGQSSPTIVGDQVFVTAEPDKLLCLDSRNGKLLWGKENDFAALGPNSKPPEKLPPTAPDCGYSAATPVTDGKSVYVCFGTGIVASYALDGKRQWIRYLDLPQSTQYGRSASPLLAGGKLLLSLSSLLALDPQTGKTLWQADDALPAYGTPALARIGDIEVALTPAGACVRISDGKILARKLAETQYCSPIVHNGVAYYLGVPTVAVKLPGEPVDAFQPAVFWKSDDVEGSFFASPLWHDGKLYCASNEGTLYVLDAGTGKMIYTKDVGIRSAQGNGGEPANIYPSLALAGKHILLSNDAGEMLVLAGGNQYEEAALNRLGKGSGASPLPHGRTLLLRSGRFVYCIGAATKP